MKKDVERTLQEFKLFKDILVQQKMEELLFIWAKEHPEFKYQQGMNELLAVVVVCLLTEAATVKTQTDKASSEDSEEEDEALGVSAKRLYSELHDPAFIWADAYAIFNRIMDLGVKELYYKETGNTPKKGDFVDAGLTPSVSEVLSGQTSQAEGAEQTKARQQKLLKRHEEDAKKTALRKKSNKIFNNYLRNVDADLYGHIQAL